MKRRIKKKFINLTLIYLIVLTPKLVINTYSKYESIINKQSEVSIAKWDINTTFSNKDLNLISGNTIDDYILTINSLSEVGYEYKIILSNVPDDILVSLNDSNYIPPDNHQIIFNYQISTKNKYQNIILHFKPLINVPNLNNYKIKIDIELIQLGGV